MPENTIEGSATPSSPSLKWHLLAVLCLALIPKLMYLEFVGPVARRDGRQYLHAAKHLLETGDYGKPRTMEDGSFVSDSVPNAGIAPAYPLCLTAMVMMFGEGPIQAQKDRQINGPIQMLYFQCILGALAACFAFLIGYRHAGYLGGWCCGLLCASYVPMMKYPAQFLTETMAVFWFLLAMLLSDSLLRRVGEERRVWPCCVGRGRPLHSAR